MRQEQHIGTPGTWRNIPQVDTQERKQAAPVQILICNCCGGETYGAQWHNRDNGFGMCDSCIAFVRSRGMDEDEIRRLYGAEGVNWGVKDVGGKV